VEVREGIVDALARIGAWDGVERLAGDPAPSVRARARRALAAHRGERPQEPRRAVEHPSEYLGAPAARRMVLETERGAIVIELEREWAPTHAAALSSLARAGFYDGLTFHRVVPNFVVQGGDSTGTGWGSAGFTLRDEVSPVAFDRGVVGIAKAGKDTGSCQMFFMLAPAPHLNGRYTVVGRIVEGLEVADALEVGDRILRAYAGE
jgi:cyclophilin family peptidyl-prolyl cis-trans isomerase